MSWLLSLWKLLAKTQLLEIKTININEDEQKIIKLQNEKNEIYNKYQNKLNEMQNNLLQESSNENNNNGSQKINFILNILEENIKDFKDIFFKKVNSLEKSTELFNKTRILFNIFG